MIEFSDYDNLSYTGGRQSATSTLSRKLPREPVIQVAMVVNINRKVMGGSRAGGPGCSPLPPAAACS